MRTQQGCSESREVLSILPSCSGDMVSPGPGAELQRASRDGHHPGYARGSRAFVPKSGLWPPPPAQTLPPPPLRESQGHQAWSEGIWGQAAQNDPDHTPACFLWFLSDIRRGFKNFPQGRGSPKCGLSSWACSQVQGGPQRREEIWYLRMRGGAAGRAWALRKHFLHPYSAPPVNTPFQPSRVLERTVTIICRGQKCQHKGQAHSPPGPAATTTWLCGTRSNDRV